MIILDTHIWIWLIQGDRKLKNNKKLHKILESGKKSEIKISAFSLWEIAMLESKKRIQFNEPCLQWIQAASSAPGISIDPITPLIAFDSANLPGEFHGDPADRIIVASARTKDMILFTADSNIINYSQEGYVKVEPIII